MADLPFTLDQLRILRAISSEGSFKKAADSLYVTQPAVSLQIQNLEKQLDVSLFDRGGRKAQLTEAGHLLLSYCDRILSQCQEACRALDDLHNLRGGSLIVGASQTTGTYLMPRMIGLFRQKYPDVSVQLQVHSTRRTSWSVANGQIDLAIIGGELPSELVDLLQVVPYTNDELVLVLPVKHPLARLPELNKDDLYRLGFVCLDAQSTTRKMVDQLLARSGLEVQRLKIEMELNSFEAIKNAVQSGLGAAFLPVVSIERELATGSLHRLSVSDLHVRRQLKLITHPARYCSRASEAFRREVLPLFASPDSPLRQPAARPATTPLQDAVVQAATAS
ncbi:LysR family transcriptional regulator [Synechococcus sp. Cruz-9H2]|jgi:DNA-binding transcriptional LysR family regulator|uniref:LysR family transcriptional regulator n=1 Tax=unclassified Synechococcus TaxID=2626047 RepID=UPI0020CCB5B3|nr:MULTISPECIES: LysR family transcriptional regulator [unclassified Synechococcus]MCP9820507.1 LysR family transcriptional regulator [Synechococcus sp. Cruz-9H2]MCP9843300.1 LysR family transcriptional regulator [Synechococcus sp. Edmonson 11F2]MCP9855045.1 LysR family transcriptional regulator [Synechococcus sp. Cruz-9C9]MCP9862484.1 LysR family transcriptional regulator [Synechococcus sp. Cruz-7E5]MCP9871393.1 LysR family transcriptional regulator [Synechococcus sp. Cruz-7B9]